MEKLQKYNSFDLNESTNSVKNGILYGEKLWMVYIFISAGSKDGTDLYKDMSPKEGDTFINLVNIIKGGTIAKEIAGIFNNYKDARKYYDSLEHRGTR